MLSIAILILRPHSTTPHITLSKVSSTVTLSSHPHSHYYPNPIPIPLPPPTDPSTCASSTPLSSSITSQSS
ncbi:hypothetical protein S245_047529, partial [Arachis hypogaea]